MSSERFNTVCVPGKSCGWNRFDDKLSCSAGDNSYWEAQLVSADESDFHTAELIEATDEIRRILKSIKRPRGRDLGFVNTPFGVLLAWVQHNIKTPRGSTS